jgi:hypothetical protein
MKLLKFNICSDFSSYNNTLYTICYRTGMFTLPVLMSHVSNAAFAQCCLYLHIQAEYWCT